MHPEANCGGMKLLLKQVYAVHTTKIKSLEEEIVGLKSNLQEAEIKLKNFELECKRCNELEEAFNSCKAALHEQSKWFENLGQKFSTINTTENKNASETAAKTCEGTIKSVGQSSVSNIVDKNNGLSNVKKHFLQNIMSLNTDGFQESLELSCAPFQKNFNLEYSSMAPDPLILAPNTLDFTCDIGKAPDKNTEHTDIKTNIAQSTLINDKPDDVKNQLGSANSNDPFIKNTKSKLSKKRFSDDSTDSELHNEKSNKEKENKIGMTKKMRTTISSNDTSNHKSVTKQITSRDSSTNDQQKAVDVDASLNASRAKKLNTTPSLDVKISKTMQDDVTDKNYKNGISSSNDTSCNKDDTCQITVSPSLIPFNEKTNSKIVNNPPVLTEDIYDFQIPPVNKKNSKKLEDLDEECSMSFNKKKVTKKVPYTRPIKSTSRFKMHLDSLPLNYKKPNFRQTKLSKSIFQPKVSTAPKKETVVECVDVDEVSSDFEVNLPSTSADLLTPNSKNMDFDATCIPDNYEYAVVSSGNTSDKPKVSRSNLEHTMIVKDSTDESEEESSMEIVIEQKTSTTNQDRKRGEVLTTQMAGLVESGNSFDRLPKKAEPNYKYKEETVRKKAERKQLTAFDCNECEKYYTELGLSDEEKQKRMHKCSRHRGKFVPPPTPEHFWELEFPDTQECKERGYLNETQKVKLKTHRRRPL